MGKPIIIMTPEKCLNLALAHAEACEARAYRRIAIQLCRMGRTALIDDDAAKAVQLAFRALVTTAGVEHHATRAMLPTVRHYCAPDLLIGPAFVDPPNPYDGKIPTVFRAKVDRRIVTSKSRAA